MLARQMKDTEKLLNWLKDYRFENLNFDILEDKKTQPNEMFCLNTTVLFWELCVKRTQELAEAYNFARERKQYVNVALAQRAALETLAVAVNQILNMLKVFETEFKDREANLRYEEEVKKIFLGMRKNDKSEKITSKNILTYLDKLGDYLAEIGGEEHRIALAGFYEELSNICHPNMPGLMGYFYPKVVSISLNSDPKVRVERDYFEIVIMLLQHFDKAIQDFKVMVKAMFTPLDSNQ